MFDPVLQYTNSTLTFYHIISIYLYENLYFSKWYAKKFHVICILNCTNKTKTHSLIANIPVPTFNNNNYNNKWNFKYVSHLYIELWMHLPDPVQTLTFSIYLCKNLYFFSKLYEEKFNIICILHIKLYKEKIRLYQM